MEYNSTVTLKNGRICRLRNGTASDGQALLDEFNLTHEQTDYLLTYPGEHSYTAEQEAAFLQEKTAAGISTAGALQVLKQHRQFSNTKVMKRPPQPAVAA